MYWDIPKIWEGGECWIIGGGPSIPRVFGVPDEVVQAVHSGESPMSAYSPFLSPIHDKHIIGVNTAFYLGPWVDILFYGDSGFYNKNKADIISFENIRVTCHPAASEDPKVVGVKCLRRNTRRGTGLAREARSVCWHKNSGAAAINLATQLGAETIFLLGFDMSLNDHDKQWWHSHYPRAHRPVNPKKLPFERHLPGFQLIARDARKMGVSIYNVSPDSKILDFAKITLEQALNGDLPPQPALRPIKDKRTMRKTKQNKNKQRKRWVWLTNQIRENRYTIGAEIGVANGNTTHRLLKNIPKLVLYAVDKFEPIAGGAEAGDMGCGRAGCEAWDPVQGRKRFDRSTAPYRDRLRLLVGDSAEMADKVEDGTLDFVFIDADHRYKAVLRDLAAWVPKLKDGGMLCGHDINLEGVKKAVSEKVPTFREADMDHVWFAKKEDYVH